MKNMRLVCKNIKFMLYGGWGILMLLNNASERCKKLIQEDVSAYIQKSDLEQKVMDLMFEDSKKTFRNVLYYRFEQDGCNERLLRLCKKIIPPIVSVEIQGGDIEGGLRIIHNHCVVGVKKAGKNLTVLQGVTIGKNIDGGKPTIGDNVIIYPNSIIFGDITIGNNVKIGAGSVVNKSIPANTVVVGNPARMIREEGMNYVV